jgi:hypothetical protein
LESNRFGIFTAALPGTRRGSLRARVVGTNVASPPFATHVSVPSNAYYPVAGVDPTR